MFVGYIGRKPNYPHLTLSGLGFSRVPGPCSRVSVMLLSCVVSFEEKRPCAKEVCQEL